MKIILSHRKNISEYDSLANEYMGMVMAIMDSNSDLSVIYPKRIIIDI